MWPAAWLLYHCGVSNTVFAGARLALCLGSVLVLAGAQAADLYVSTQGSDSNSGTSSSPFRTITYAYSRASAGTTIHVLAGTYYDYTSGWGIHLGNSGSAASPIVLHSETRGGTIIDGQNASDRNEGFYIDGSYNTVDGFEIRNCPSGGFAVYGNGNRIMNSHIHNNGNPASSSTNGRDGIYSAEGTSGNYYAGNYIHDNGRTGSNLDHGLYLCGQNETIINNILMHNAACGLQVAGYTTVINMKVYNNVMAWNGTDGIILWQALSGVDIKNNILYENGHYGIGSYAATGTGVVVDHNLSYGNGSGSYDFSGGSSTYSYTLGTVLSSDPLLVNESSSSFDAHLSARSPAIQAGMNLYSSLTTDMSSAARPASGAWDLGPYVYASANTPPTITSIAGQSTASGCSAGPLAFTVGDAQTPASNLNLSGTSSSTTLVPNANITFGGSGANRTVTVTPVIGQTGNAMITLTVSDGSGNASTSFNLTVAAVAPPALQISVQGGNALIRWPTNTGSYTLQAKGMALAPGAWVDLANAPVLDQNQYLVSDPATNGCRWYRLRSQ